MEYMSAPMLADEAIKSLVQVVSWETCDIGRCAGVRLPEGGKCWAHAEQSDLDMALERLDADGELDARGVRITEELLVSLLAATPRDGHRLTLARADFTSAVFEGPVFFEHIVFKGEAYFNNTVFEREAVFKGASWLGQIRLTGSSFKDVADFSRASFGKNAIADFSLTTFCNDANFPRAVFHHDADFDGATFERTAWFPHTVFDGKASFNRARFVGAIAFPEARFHGDAWFQGAYFKDPVTFGGVIFDGGAFFSEGIFEQARSIGPLLARREIGLDGARFTQPIQITASTPYLSCRSAQFPQGGKFWLRGASIVLDDSTFQGPSIVAGIPQRPKQTLSDWELGVDLIWSKVMAGKMPDRPQLLSLQRADVAGLELSGIDLANCRFAGAHNLDKLRLEADAVLAAAPALFG